MYQFQEKRGWTMMSQLNFGPVFEMLSWDFSAVSCQFVSYSCLLLYSCAETLTKANLVRRGFISAYRLYIVHHWGKLRQRVKQNHDGILHTALFFLASSDYFHILPQTNCSPEALPTVSWALSHTSQVNAPCSYRRIFLWRQFLSWDSCFSGNSLLYQIDENQPSTGLEPDFREK